MQDGFTSAIGKHTATFVVCVLIATLLMIATKSISQEIELYVHFSPDCWGNENSWVLVDEHNQTIAEAPLGSFNTSFPSPEATQILPVKVQYGQCYSFIVTDSQGDGMAGSIWDSCAEDGRFAIISSKGDTITKMKHPQFGGVHSDYFCIQSGCTTPLATNYDPDATLNDGSCVMPAIIADFIAKEVNHNCEYVTYQFENLSVGATSFRWIFENGIPSTSEDANPMVKFPTGTVCQIQLSAQNQNEQHTVKRSFNTLQPEPGTSVSLVIEPDCFGEDISWVLRNSANEVIRQVSPGTYANTFSTNSYQIEEPFCLSNDCYTFSISDEYGDGLNGGSFMQCPRNGSYYLKTLQNERILEQSNPNFGSTVSQEFCIDQLFVWDGSPDFWTGKSSAKQPGKDDNVYINSPGSTLILNEDITVNSLVIAPNTEVKLDNSSRKVRLYGDLVNNGTLNLSHGIIAFEGEKTQHIKGTQVATLSKLYLNNPDTLRLFNDLNINGIVQLKQGVLDINNHDLKLTANHEHQGAIAKIQSPASILGDTITFETYYPANPGAWRLICSPIEGATFEEWNDDFPTTGFEGANYPNYPTPETRSSNILMYDETFSKGDEANLKIGFTSIHHIKDRIDPKKGYFTYFVPGPTTLDVRGKFIQGDVRIPLNYTASEGDHTHDGWNLISNPYPCAINWDDLPPEHKKGIDYAIYAYDPDNGQYSSYVGGVSIGNLSNRIEPGQAFWVKAIEENAEILFTEDAKTPEQGVHMPSIDINTEALIRIRISKDNFRDDCVIGFNSTATQNFDPTMDAYKFYPTESKLPSIAVIPESKSLSMSISMLPVPKQDIAIPLELKTGNFSELYISNLDIDSYDDDYCFILEDRELQKSIPFNKGQVYKFTITSQTSPDRFVLHVQAPINYEITHTGCPQSGTTSIKAFGYGNAPWDFIWTNDTGEIVQHHTNTSKPDVLLNVEPGFYQVEVSNSQRICKSAVKIVEVTAHQSPPNISVSPIHTTCNSDQSGSLIAHLDDSVEWNLSLYNEEGELVQERTSQNPICEFNDLDAQTYQLIASNNCGTQQVIENLDLRDPSAITASLHVSRRTTSLEEGGAINFTAHADNAETYHWDFGDGSTTANSPLIQHTYVEEGNFLATVVAKNEHCQQSVSQPIIITLNRIEQLPRSLDSAQTSDVAVHIADQTLMLQTDLEKACIISIYNMNGALVHSESVSAEALKSYQLNISQMATGMYSIHLTSLSRLLFSDTFFKQ